MYAIGNHHYSSVEGVVHLKNIFYFLICWIIFIQKSPTELGLQEVLLPKGAELLLCEQPILQAVDQLLTKKNRESMRFVVLVERNSLPLLHFRKLFVLDQLVLGVELIEKARPIMKLKAVGVDP